MKLKFIAILLLVVLFNIINITCINEANLRRKKKAEVTEESSAAAEASSDELSSENEAASESEGAPVDKEGQGKGASPDTPAADVAAAARPGADVPGNFSFY